VDRLVRAELRRDNARRRAWVAEQGRANALLVGENAALSARLAELTERLAKVGRRLGQSPRNSTKPPST
jgi:hypothetical protein